MDDIEIPQASHMELRPVLTQMIERCTKDWGVAPHYTPEYKSIRWTHSHHSGRPMWLHNLLANKRRKQNNQWDATWGQRSTFVGGNLHADLTTCMRLNIPFKTPSIEYKPCNQWVYIRDIKRIKYDLVSGRIKGFTYGGTYDKFVSLVLRRFGLEITRTRKGLNWRNSPDNSGMDFFINLDTFYDIHDGVRTLIWKSVINSTLRIENVNLEDSAATLTYVQPAPRTLQPAPQGGIMHGRRIPRFTVL